MGFREDEEFPADALPPHCRINADGADIPAPGKNRFRCEENKSRGYIFDHADIGLL
jgi:hypothetical protein